MVTSPPTTLLARLLLVATAPLACTPSSSPSASPDSPASVPSSTAAAPPAATPPATATGTPTTTPHADATPTGKDGHPTTGGSTTDNGCYPRAAGETCLAPDAPGTAARLKLGVDGTVKHLKTAPGTDATCCYTITSVSKGRVLVVSGAIRVASLVRRAYA